MYDFFMPLIALTIYQMVVNSEYGKGCVKEQPWTNLWPGGTEEKKKLRTVSVLTLIQTRNLLNTSQKH
jgi:hypothetical protein